MTEFELLKYCHYYNGEGIPPLNFDKKEKKIWFAEKMICGEFQNLVDRKNPRKSIAELIASYIGKWDPWDWPSVMETYLKNTPDLRQYIFSVYS